MSHNSNGQIYIDTRTTPHTGISTGDIGYVLGAGSNDVGTLCSHPKINPWAKFKPVSASDVDFSKDQYDATNNAWKSTANWYKCPSPADNTLLANACGFRVASTSNYANIPSMYASAPWAHQRPRGLSYNEVFRMMDFAWYDHRATPVVEASDFISNRNLVPPQDTDGVLFSCEHEHPVSQTIIELEWGDFPVFQSCHFGVMMQKQGGGDYAIATSDTTVSGNSFRVKLDTRTLSKGTYIAYPFLCTEEIIQGDPLPSCTFYSLPFVPAVTVVVDDVFIITITASFDQLGQLIYSVSATNNGDSAQSFVGAYAIYRKSTHAWDDPWDNDESATVDYFSPQGASGTITVNANSTYTFNPTVYHQPSYSGYVLVVMGAYHESANADNPNTV